jgi:glutathione S-transferase
MAKELDITFKHQPTDWRTCGKDPDYLAINPAGSIPCLREDDFILAESMAINLYLAKKYQKLWPHKECDQATALQWSFWAATSLEELYIRWADHQHWLPPQLRKPELATAAMKELNRPLSRLEAALSNRPWLLEDRFTVADLNVASVICFPSGAPLTRWPHVSSWLSSCVQRTAFKDAARLP